MYSPGVGIVAEDVHPGLEVELGAVVQLLDLLGLAHVTPACTSSSVHNCGSRSGYFGLTGSGSESVFLGGSGNRIKFFPR